MLKQFVSGDGMGCRGVKIEAGFDGWEWVGMGCHDVLEEKGMHTSNLRRKHDSQDHAV